MSKLIKDIYDKFLSILNDSENEYKSKEDMIDNIYICEGNEEKAKLKSMNNLDKIVMVEELHRYNNHIPEKNP